MRTFIDRPIDLLDSVLEGEGDAEAMRRSRLWAMMLVASVCIISLLHYVTSVHSVPFHEIFQRLYYLPIVMAAIIYGVKGGLATAALSAALFVPHVIFNWHAWPVFQLGQYAEVFVFTLVGGMTGLLADRLRAQRDRCRRTAVELDDTCQRLEASIDERVRADRLVTIGRVASGIAHEIRTPLGGLLGSLEILGADIPAGHPKREFVAIATQQIERLNRTVTEFLDFARPPAAATRPADLAAVVDAAARLARPTLAVQGGDVRVEIVTSTPHAVVDVDQLQRALLNILLDETAIRRHAHIRLTVDAGHGLARITIATPLTADRGGINVAELFEPFPASDPGAGLTLAAVRRVIENQRGTIRAELAPGSLRYVIELPLVAGDAADILIAESADTPLQTRRDRRLAH